MFQYTQHKRNACINLFSLSLFLKYHLIYSKMITTCRFETKLQSSSTRKYFLHALNQPYCSHGVSTIWIFVLFSDICLCAKPYFAKTTARLSRLFLKIQNIVTLPWLEVLIGHRLNMFGAFKSVLSGAVIMLEHVLK